MKKTFFKLGIFSITVPVIVWLSLFLRPFAHDFSPKYIEEKDVVWLFSLYGKSVWLATLIGGVCAVFGLIKGKGEGKSTLQAGAMLNFTIFAIASFILLQPKPWYANPPDPRFENVERVDFMLVNFNNTPMKFSVADKDKINELVKHIRIGRTGALKHQPFSDAFFVKRNETIHTRFTSLCFEIQNADGSRVLYKIDPEFHKLINKYKATALTSKKRIPGD
jgi:hypothetical protein